MTQNKLSVKKNSSRRTPKKLSLKKKKVLKCLNDPSKEYTGTEPSPKGLGYCAHAEKIGSIRVGNDGNVWKVIETSKKTKMWVIQSKYFTKRPISLSEYLVPHISPTDPKLEGLSVQNKKLLLKLCNNKTLTQRLAEKNIKLLIYIWGDWKLMDEPHFLGQPRSEIDWYSKEPWEVLVDEINKDNKNGEYSYIIVPVPYDSIEKKYVLLEDMLELRHSFSQKKHGLDAIQIFEDTFKDEFFWTGDTYNPIEISVPKKQRSVFSWKNLRTYFDRQKFFKHGHKPKWFLKY